MNDQHSAADRSELLIKAGKLFSDGLTRYYPGVALGDTTEFDYFAWSALIVALKLWQVPGPLLEKAFEVRILEAIGVDKLVLYRRRFLEYAPLLIDNFRSITPVRELSDALDRHVIGSPVEDQQHGYAVATYVLVAAELVEATRPTAFQA